MYSDQDFINAKQGMKKALTLTILVCIVPLALFIVSLVMRWHIPCWIGAVALGWLGYGLLQLKCIPWIRYVLWFKDMRSGLSREMDAQFVSISNETRLSDGIEVHEMIVRVGDREEDERLFLWDHDKPLPVFKADQMLHITSFGNYVTDVAAA